MDFHREAPHFACKVEGPLAARDRREANEAGRAFAKALERVGPGIGSKRLMDIKEAFRAIATGMDDPVGNTLVVELEGLFAEMKVVSKGVLRSAV